MISWIWLRLLIEVDKSKNKFEIRQINWQFTNISTIGFSSVQLYTVGTGTPVKSVKVISICHTLYNVEV